MNQSNHIEVELKHLVTHGREERVTVNQRALIDKLLARYKGHFTVFRELIQNSDDARATHVRVKLINFKNTSSQNQSQKGKTIWVQNNGAPFSTADWDRLIKIAEGNFLNSHR